MKNHFLLILLLAAFYTCQPQEKGDAERTYPVGLLRQDVVQLQNALVTYHPGIDRHVPLKDITEEFAQAIASLPAKMTAWEFYRHISPLVANVQCGHTRLALSPELQTHLDTSVIYFPLPVILTSYRMFARLPDNDVAEVLSINGKTTRDILEKIFSSFAVDGKAEDSKHDFILHFGDYYARYVDHRPEKFAMTVRKIGKTENENITVAAINFRNARKLLTPETRPITFEMIGEIGYLKVRTFSSYSYNSAHINYYDFLEKTFSEIRKRNIGKLIVDIRDNGGGDDQYGATLFSYLTKNDFGYFKKVYTKSANGFVDVDHPCVALQQVKPMAFGGKACLLINGKIFSTAADVASVFKSNKRGSVIGRETGGGYNGNTSGRSERVTLEHSKIVINIPLWFYENAVVEVSEKHHGVIPDIKTKRTPEELVDKKDIELEMALKSLNE
jgi:hypothetical protein